MGLTHYWHRATELPRDTFKAAVDDCRRLISGTDVDVAGFDGSGDPILDDDRIVFNGRARGACEPFEIAAVEFDRQGRPDVFSYCKTEYQPYDLLVRAVLIVLSHHLGPALCVSSDEEDSTWNDARDLVAKHLGYGQSFTLTME